MNLNKNVRRRVGIGKRYFAYLYRELPHRVSARFSKDIGITGQKRQQQIIVSLTTIPQRLDKAHLAINTLLRQNLKPNKILLWIGNAETGAIPKQLYRLQRRGLEIRWHKDVGPLTKFVPTRRAFPNALIVTADDDTFYGENWLADLYEAYLLEPQYIHTHRAHEITFSGKKPKPYKEWNWESVGIKGPSMKLFPTGVGGVLYAPTHLHPEVLNTETCMDICPTADDVWLKAMAMLNNTSCKKVHAISSPLREVQFSNNVHLGLNNYFRGGNDRQLAAVMQHYNIGFPD